MTDQPDPTENRAGERILDNLKHHMRSKQRLRDMLDAEIAMLRDLTDQADAEVTNERLRVERIKKHAGG
jgi:hypothetical protein